MSRTWELANKRQYAGDNFAHAMLVGYNGEKLWARANKREYADFALIIKFMGT